MEAELHPIKTNGNSTDADPGTSRRSLATMLKVWVPAVTAVVVALIGAYAQSSAGEARKAAQEATTAAAGVVPIPVGTIVASILSEQEFARISGDPPVPDPTKSKWALARGGQVVGSKYAEFLNGRELPDLRGMFLRGQNAGRGGEFQAEQRKLGDSQPWSTSAPKALALSTAGAHVHYAETGKVGFVGRGQGAHAAVGEGQPMPAYGGYAMSSEGAHTHELSGRDNETRPNNVTVNYFVRINP